MAYRKRKKKKNLFAVFIILLLLIVTLVILIVSKSCSPAPTPSVTESESRETSGESGGNESGGETETESVTETETEVPYEMKVGVNYAIDITPYLSYIDPENPDMVLVNLSNPLPSGFVPENLVISQYTRKDGRAGQMLRQNVEVALEAMMKEAEFYSKANNVSITSAYRSEDRQRELFEGYVAKEMNANPSLTREEAEKITLEYSMKPGCSEHQTGLCFDMHNLSAASTAFGNTEEGIWFAQNCYRFGFIIRYPQDKVDITGVMWEPWHFRFVGRKAATEMHELNMCLEEYTEYLKTR